jgi:hypothetical protein
MQQPRLSDEDYQKHLDQFLWHFFSNDNEPLEEFVMLIRGCYFSKDVISFDLLTEASNIQGFITFDDLIKNANLFFLSQGIPMAREKLTLITKKVTELAGESPDAEREKNKLLLWLLSILYSERDLKPNAQFRISKQIPELRKSTKKYCDNLHQSVRTLMTTMSEQAENQYVELQIRGAVSDKMRELGFTLEMCTSLANFVEQVRSDHLSFLDGKKSSEAFAKRPGDFSTTSRDLLGYLLENLKTLGIRPEQAKREVAILLDLFGIRSLEDVKKRLEIDQALTDEVAIRTLAKRIGDVLTKKRRSG